MGDPIISDNDGTDKISSTHRHRKSPSLVPEEYRRDHLIVKELGRRFNPQPFLDSPSCENPNSGWVRERHGCLCFLPRRAKTRHQEPEYMSADYFFIGLGSNNLNDKAFSGRMRLLGP